MEMRFSSSLSGFVSQTKHVGSKLETSEIINIPCVDCRRKVKRRVRVTSEINDRSHDEVWRGNLEKLKIKKIEAYKEKFTCSQCSLGLKNRGNSK